MPNFEIYLYMWSILKAYRMLSLTKKKKTDGKIVEISKVVHRYYWCICDIVVSLNHLSFYIKRQDCWCNVR